MTATSVYPSSFASPPRRRRTGVGARSTSSVRTRYRRQTATLMLGTTVVGVWLALAAPTVSPVVAAAPPAAVGVTDPGGVPATGPSAPTRRNDETADAGPRGRAPYRGHGR